MRLGYNHQKSLDRLSMRCVTNKHYVCWNGLTYLYDTGMKPMKSKLATSLLNNPLRISLLFVGALMLAPQAWAVPTADEFNESVNEVINGVTIFTSQDTASSGTFSFDSDDSDASDADIEILKIPARFTFGEESDVLRPQVRGVFGNLESKRSITTGGPGTVDDFSRLEVLTFGTAGGVVYNPWKELRVTPLVGIAYSHLKRRYDYNNSYSQTNLLPYDREAFNTSVDVLTYSPTIEVDYTFRDGAATFIPKIRYTYLYNDSVSSKSSVIDIESDSSMLQSFFDAEMPLGCSVFGQDLGVHPFIVRTDLFGTAKDARGPNYFYELGADLLITEADRKLLSGFSVGASYIWGEDFSGYRIGLGLVF